MPIYQVRVPAMTGEDWENEVIAENEQAAMRKALLKATEAEGFTKKGNIVILGQRNDTSKLEVAVIDQQEQKGLAEILVIPDELPADFYKNTEKYQAILDEAIATAKTLVHPIDEEGRKKAKADAAMIRKFAATNDKWSLSVFRSLTDKVKLWKDGITGKTKLLNAEADSIMNRFDELEKAQLAEIRAMINNALLDEFDSKGVRQEFRNNDIEKLVRLTAVTPKGKLTGATAGVIAAIANDCYAMQNKIDSRKLIVANRSLLAEINPPLSPEYLGPALYADDAIFEAKLNEFVEIEVKRRAETEARVIRDQEAKRKREEALKAQQELEMKLKIQREEALKARQEAQIKETQEALEKDLKAHKEDQLTAMPIEQKEAPVIVDPPADGNVLIEFKAVFSSNYPARFSDGALADGFNRRLSGIFEKAIMAGILDDTEKRILSTFSTVEVRRVS